MRIIGYIDHADLKITVFKMNNKISIKLESDLLEQTYKYRTSPILESLEDVKRLVTSEWIAKVETAMQQQRALRNDGLQTLIAQREKEEEFDDII